VERLATVTNEVFLKLHIRCFGPLLAGVLVLCTGCASQGTDTEGPVQLIQASAEIPESQLLDVGVQVFDPGLPAEGEPVPDRVFPEVRKSESRYLAIQLERTLQETGQWGAVRVLPTTAGAVDLEVSGRIIESTGKELVVHITAVDATGRVWINDKYKEVADPVAYVEGKVETRDPFQDLYNRISNDLLAARDELKAAQMLELRQVSELKFAAHLAPTPFSEYLEVNKKGRYTVARLPAEGDPMMERVARVREREYMFVDTLNQHYANFYAQMTEPYDSWRKYSYDEQVNLENLRRKARTQKILGALAVLGAMFAQVNSGTEAVVRDAAALGGMAAIQAGMATSKEAKIHIEALRELGASFEAEVEPLIIDVEGHTLRLSGSIETQYEQWQQLLREIYLSETGLPVDPNAPPQTPRESGISGGETR